MQGDSEFLERVIGTGFGCDVSGGVVRGAPELRPIDIDLRDMPDTAMTAAVLACFASPVAGNEQAVSRLRGVETLRVKETDRLAALQTELTKIGADVEIETTRAGHAGMGGVGSAAGVASGSVSETLVIAPTIESLRWGVCRPGEVREVVFDTYDDHRMAMSLALVGLRRPGVVIANPACVAKTYPMFWRDLRSLYA